ncbi:MAG TPA: hypothetical protein VHO47_03915 [Candidatus Babeliales bacterium]|nr:hypothetical protein [Candidatus Babeliales bacterium]
MKKNQLLLLSAIAIFSAHAMEEGNKNFKSFLAGIKKASNNNNDRLHGNRIGSSLVTFPNSFIIQCADQKIILPSTPKNEKIATALRTESRTLKNMVDDKILEGVKEIPLELITAQDAENFLKYLPLNDDELHKKLKNCDFDQMAGVIKTSNFLDIKRILDATVYEFARKIDWSIIPAIENQALESMMKRFKDLITPDISNEISKQFLFDKGLILRSDYNDMNKINQKLDSDSKRSHKEKKKAVLDMNGKVQIHDWHSGKLQIFNHEVPFFVSDTAISEDGTKAVIGGEKGYIQVLDFEKKILVGPLGAFYNDIMSVAFIGNNLIAVRNLKGDVRIWDIKYTFERPKLTLDQSLFVISAARKHDKGYSQLIIKDYPLMIAAYNTLPTDIKYDIDQKLKIITKK